MSQILFEAVDSALHRHAGSARTNAGRAAIVVTSPGLDAAYATRTLTLPTALVAAVLNCLPHAITKVASMGGQASYLIDPKELRFTPGQLRAEIQALDLRPATPEAAVVALENGITLLVNAVVWTCMFHSAAGQVISDGTAIQACRAVVAIVDHIAARGFKLQSPTAVASVQGDVPFAQPATK